MGLFQEFNHVSDNAAIAPVEKRGCFSGITSTTSTTNTMDIIVDICRQIVVDNMNDIGDVKTS